MDYQELANIIKKEFPEKAIDIVDSLELLRFVINDTIESIGDEMNENYSQKQYEKASAYPEIASEIAKYEVKIGELSNIFEIDDLSIVVAEDDDEDKKSIPNYNDFIIDNSVIYTLYETFTHKRPFGFKIKDNKIIEANTWQEVLLKTCEVLIEIDPEKFMDFENKESMNGKKNKYFSINSKNVPRPKKVGNGIYVNTNQSANSIRNLIIKMLKEYKFKITDFKVFLRADYTNLNGS